MYLTQKDTRTRREDIMVHLFSSWLPDIKARQRASELEDKFEEDLVFAINMTKVAETIRDRMQDEDGLRLYESDQPIRYGYRTDQDRFSPVIQAA